MEYQGDDATAVFKSVTWVAAYMGLTRFFFLRQNQGRYYHRGYSESKIMGMVGSVICFLMSDPIDPIGTWDDDPN